MKPFFKMISAMFVAVLFLVLANKSAFAQEIQIDCQSGFNEINTGMFYKNETVTSPRNISMYIVKIDLTQPMDFVVTPRDGLGTTTSVFMGTYGVELAINGDGFRNPSDPTGFAASEGDIYSDAPIWATLFIPENPGPTDLPQIGLPRPEDIFNAISGFQIIAEGEDVEGSLEECCLEGWEEGACTEDDYYGHCQYLRARTSVGINEEDNEFIIIVVDEVGGSSGVSIRELADLQLQCGSTNAMNMDGGGSSTLVEAGLGILNNPSGGTERIVANHLGVCYGTCNTGIGPAQPPLPAGEARPRYTITQPYPFPCNRTAPLNSSWVDEEFHSLRPYQASPCNQTLDDLALFCGNDLVLPEEVTITKNFNSLSTNIDDQYFRGPIEVFPGNPDWNLSSPCLICGETGVCERNDISACIPEANQCGPEGSLCSCRNNENGTETCSFTVSNSRDVAVDLEGLQLPIMGYTEPSVGNEDISQRVVNSVNDSFSDETLNDLDKMNEYVSWYLNGVNERAEYPYLDVQKECLGESSDIPGVCESTVEPNLCNPEADDAEDWTFDGVGGCYQSPDHQCCINSNDGATGYLDRDKLINFSGPLKKLLPASVQQIERIEEVEKAEGSVINNARIRHDQVVGCDFSFLGISLRNVPLPCYEEVFSVITNLVRRRIRLTNYTDEDRQPPIVEDLPPEEDLSFQEFYIEYREWRGDYCARIPLNIFNLIAELFPNPPEFLRSQWIFCFDNPLSVNVFSNLFNYIPLSSTEDRLGNVEIRSYRVQPSGTSFRIIRAVLSNTEPADLFFPHMQETVELADLLQRTFANRDAELEGEPADVVGNEFCELRQVRSNPGDDLFAGELSATFEYTAQVMCNFYTTDIPGTLCSNLIQGGGCVQNGTYCESYYGQYDCSDGQVCGVNCSTPPSPGGCTGTIGCFPENYENCDVVDPSVCGPDYFCAEIGVGECTRTDADPPLTQDCTRPIYARLQLQTKTPLADQIWSRLVSGPSGVFKKFAPKPGPEGPLECILDMPAGSGYTYEFDGQQLSGQLYFPHIGGIYEYFLKGIQSFLRPQGYGNSIVVGSPGDPLCSIAEDVSDVSTDICSGQCNATPSSVCQNLPPNLQARFEDLAYRWLGGVGAPRYDKYDDVINSACNRTDPVDPVFALAIWLHESGASNYEGICQVIGHGDPNSGYCQRILDFGINRDELATLITADGTVIRDMFEPQLSSFLNLPGYYLSQCDLGRVQCPMEMYGSMYYYGSCTPINNSNAYIAGIQEVYSWLWAGGMFPCYPTATN